MSTLEKVGTEVFSHEVVVTGWARKFVGEDRAVVLRFLKKLFQSQGEYMGTGWVERKMLSAPFTWETTQDKEQADRSVQQLLAAGANAEVRKLR
jgi:hypothetical protein